MERYGEQEVLLNSDETAVTHLTSPVALDHLVSILPVTLQMRRQEYVRACRAPRPWVEPVDVRNKIAILEKMILRATVIRISLN